MMPKRERKVRKCVSKLAKYVFKGWNTYDDLKNPLKTILKRNLRRLSKINNIPKRKGRIKNRIQFFNPRTISWIIQDTRTRRILRHKKGYKPFRNVRIQKSN